MENFTQIYIFNPFQKKNFHIQWTISAKFIDLQMIFPYVPIKNYILNGDLPAFQHDTGASFGPRLFGGFLKWGTRIFMENPNLKWMI